MKQLVYLVLFTVFVGITVGKKLDCLDIEIPACAQKLNITFQNKTLDICVKVGAAVACLDSAAKKCKDEAPKAMKDLIDVARNFCNKDSQIYKDLRTYGQCLAKPTVSRGFVQSCLLDYIKEYVELGEPDKNNMQEYSEKLMKMICPKLDNTVNCAYGHVKSECGEPAEKFVRKVIGPVNELLKESCDDSASLPSISMALIFLQLLVAIFSSRKIF